MENLELATNDELVEELLSRTTFRGVILRQYASFKGTPEDEWRWDARSCDAVQAINAILPHIAEEAGE